MSDQTRQVCARCHRRGWGFMAPDDLFDLIAGDAWRGSDICVFCYSELGDEKWVVWTEGLEIAPMSLREQREFVEMTQALDLLHDAIEGVPT